MTKTLYLALVLCLISITGAVAQTNIVVSKPQLEFKDNNIIVFYNILNSEESQSFRVWLDVSDTEGNKIETRALSGDVGNGIDGGTDKKIFWNLTADNIYIDALLSVKINAELVKAEIKNPGTEVAITASSFKEYTGVNRGGLYVQSLLFPGWGMSRIGKGPHWLKGVAGYGCFVGSFVYNTKALTNYRDYKNTIDVKEGNRLYALSTKQDRISEGLAIAGAVVWLTDLIWTFGGTQKIKNSLHASGISIEPYYEAFVNAPVIALKYNF